MEGDIKPRNIRILRELPISQMTDEEIVKAAMDRLQTKACMLGYIDDNRWVFSWRYKNGHSGFIRGLKEHIEDWFGCKLIKVREEE